MNCTLQPAIHLKCNLYAIYVYCNIDNAARCLIVVLLMESFFFSFSTGHFCGSLFKSPHFGILLLPVIISTLLLFGGFLIRQRFVKTSSFMFNCDKYYCCYYCYYYYYYYLHHYISTIFSIIIIIIIISL